MSQKGLMIVFLRVYYIYIYFNIHASHKEIFAYFDQILLFVICRAMLIFCVFDKAGMITDYGCKIGLDTLQG